MNNIFDFLNTRNFLNKGQFEKSLISNDKEHITLFIQESVECIESLQIQINYRISPLTKSGRKTGFEGLIVVSQV